MIIKGFENREILVEKLIVCDVCGRKELKNSDEAEEFVTIYHSCKENSIFENGADIWLDMCQHCLKERLGQFIRVEMD